MGANLTLLADIKDLTLKTDTLKGEKKSKPNGPNLLINPVDETNQEVDALRFGNQRGGYNRGFRGESTNTEDKVEEETSEEDITTPEEITPQIKTEEKTSLTTQTIQITHRINNKLSKHLHLKEAQTMELEEPCLDKQANGALTAKKLHTTQPNVGAAERRQ
jgi:hypothetical protein